MRAVSALFALMSLQAFGQSIPTRSGNNLRTGTYADTILTPQAVASRGLRVWFKLPMEGDARGTESQPLLAPNVTVQDGSNRNLLIVSSLNALVWAYDSVTSDIVWVQKLGVPVQSNNSIDYWNINNYASIYSTGVVDPDTSVWYGVAWVASDGVPQHGKHYVYGLNLKDGSFAFAPVLMPSEYDGIMRKQRSSLALATFSGHKTLFWGSGTVLETSSTAAGYLCAFDIPSHKVTLLPMAKAGGGAGVWMSGAGLIIDESKQLILGVASNGTFNPSAGDYAEAVFHATYTPPSETAAGKLSIADWWAPYLDNWRSANSPHTKLPRLAGHSLSTAKEVDGQPVNGMHEHDMPKGAAMGDEDLGSAQGFYLPSMNEFGVSGKDGVLYMVNLTNMGKTQPTDLSSPAGLTANLAKLLSPPIWFAAYAGDGVSTDPTNAQALNNNVWFDGKTHHVHMEPVLDGTYVYVGGENSNVRAWRANPDHTLTFLANSDDVASPDLANKPPGGMTGSMLCATSAGILVAVLPHGDANRTVTGGIIIVYDSHNFESRADGSKRLKVLWRSDQHGINFLFNKFDVPIVWQGKIYVPTYDGNYGTMVLGLN